MIRSFRDKDTEATWQRRYVTKLSPELSRLAYNKREHQRPTGAAGQPAGEAGRRPRRQYSIRVNDQWRIRVTWSAGGAGNVELVDYH